MIKEKFNHPKYDDITGREACRSFLSDLCEVENLDQIVYEIIQTEILIKQPSKLAPTSVNGSVPNPEVLHLLDPKDKILQDFYFFSASYDDFRDLPESSGIYAVLANIEGKDEFIYVGRSKNVKTRWINHHRAPEMHLMQKLGIKLQFRVMDLGCRLIQLVDEQLAQIERTLIEAAKPKLNDTPTYYNIKSNPLYGSFKDAKETFLVGEQMAKVLRQKEFVA